MSKDFWHVDRQELRPLPEQTRTAVFERIGIGM